MNLSVIKMIAASSEVALVLSLVFNLVCCAAIWRLWKSREALQDRVTGMLTELLSEITKLASGLVERDK